MAECIIISNGIRRQHEFFLPQRSLGPYRIHSALKNAGFDALVIDFIEDFSEEETYTALKNNIGKETLWVGFSTTFFGSYGTDPNQVDFVERVIRITKSLSDCKIICGGASFAPRILTKLGIDYFVNGSADESIINLTNYIKTGDNTHLPYVEELVNSDGVVIKHILSEKYKTPDLDKIFTDWTDPSYGLTKGEPVTIELARGCIFKCKFCDYPLLGKKKGTYTVDPGLMRENLIRLWESNGTTDYYLADNTFNDDNDKMETLHKMFTSLPFRPRFSTFIRLDLINRFPHQAEMLTEMGLVSTYLGIESLNYESARAIGKGLHPNKVKDRLYWLKEKWNGKASITGGFIFGLPYDTEAYFQEFLKWCLQKDNPLDCISISPLWLSNKRSEFSSRSEFELNPEIYGYEIEESKQNSWALPSQNLSYEKCKLITDTYLTILQKRQKINDFSLITAINSGVSLEDALSLPFVQIYAKYNFRDKYTRKESVNEYKQRTLRKNKTR